MIRSYRHKGLAKLADADKLAKIGPDLRARTFRRLDAFAAAKTPETLRLPGFDFHPLHGVPQRCSVHVNGTWWLTFGLKGKHAVDVDLENHHRGASPMKTTKRCPIHPGETLREDSLPALGLSAAAFARALGVSRRMVLGIMDVRSAMSPEMAVRLVAFFGNGPQLLIDSSPAAISGWRKCAWRAICRRPSGPWRRDDSGKSAMTGNRCS